jgi:hypothetical protein
VTIPSLADLLSSLYDERGVQALEKDGEGAAVVAQLHGFRVKPLSRT